MNPQIKQWNADLLLRPSKKSESGFLLLAVIALSERHCQAAATTAQQVREQSLSSSRGRLFLAHGHSGCHPWRQCRKARAPSEEGPPNFEDLILRNHQGCSPHLHTVPLQQLRLFPHNRDHYFTPCCYCIFIQGQVGNTIRVPYTDTLHSCQAPVCLSLSLSDQLLVLPQNKQLLFKLQPRATQSPDTSPILGKIVNLCKHGRPVQNSTLGARRQ